MPFYHPLLEEFTQPIIFYTATILNWNHLLQDDLNKYIIIGGFTHLVDAQRLTIYAFVIMPNHIHALFSVRAENTLYEVQRDFNKYTAQQLKANMWVNDPYQLEKYRSTQKDREYQIWKRRPRSTPVYNEKTFLQKLNYIHNNPCRDKWKLAKNPEDYKFSSASFYSTGHTEWDFLTHYRE